METNNLIFPGTLRTIGVDETAKWTIKYDQPGTYEYTIREIAGDEAGVEYDGTLYYVTVVMDYLEDENGDRMSLIPVSITYTDAEGNVIYVDEYTEADDEDDTVTDADDTTDPDEGDGNGEESSDGSESGARDRALLPLPKWPACADKHRRRQGYGFAAGSYRWDKRREYHQNPFAGSVSFLENCIS